MEKLNRGDKIYLDRQELKESAVNAYLGCRDGVVEVCEYTDCSGYGSKAKIFYCQDVKSETVAIIRHTYNDIVGEWIEEDMVFDSDSFTFLKSLINGMTDGLGAKYSLVRDYMD